MTHSISLCDSRHLEELTMLDTYWRHDPGLLVARRKLLETTLSYLGISWQLLCQAHIHWQLLCQSHIHIGSCYARPIYPHWQILCLASGTADIMPGPPTQIGNCNARLTFTMAAVMSDHTRTMADVMPGPPHGSCPHPLRWPT